MRAPEFTSRMKQLLMEEYTKFEQSFSEPSAVGLRVNTCKTTVSFLKQHTSFLLEQVPWCETGYYYQNRPGKHPYHEAGLYYIQEPSAMAVVELLDPQPGEMVLDVAAAPGGKSTHIATKMKDQGLLIANEIIPKRAKILASNIERLGVTNTIVMNASPTNLKAHLHAIFDRVLVDAPCSGEGMFRKDETAINEWSLANVEMCALRQKDILEEVYHFVKQGGRLVYSTCTFSVQENESVIREFLKRHPDFHLITPHQFDGFSSGVDMPEAVRLYPHKIKGEGHFIAVLERDGSESSRFLDSSIKFIKPHSELIEFTQTYLLDFQLDNLIGYGAHIYQSPSSVPSFNKLKVLSIGRHLGELKKNRFEPSHHLALSFFKANVRQSIELSVEEVTTYLAGGTIPNKHNHKGWVLVMVDGHSIGWGKASNNQIKNHYPKGLRIPKTG